jgi:ligand-binding sensor protein
MKMAGLFNTSMDYIMGLSNIKNSVQASDLDDKERELISAYRKLNIIQKEKAMSYMDGLRSQ